MERVSRSVSQCQPLCSETRCSSATCSARLSLLALATRKNWQINHLCGVVTVTVWCCVWCCHSHCVLLSQSLWLRVVVMYRMELEAGTAHHLCTSYMLKSTVLGYCLYYCVKRTAAKSHVSLTSTCPCMANIFSEHNQQDATFHNLFISVRRSTCFRRVFRPPSGAQNCTYSVRYWSVCAVLSSWWRMEKPSETCRASHRNK